MKVLAILLVLLLPACLAQFILGQKPGFKIRATNKAFAFVNDLAQIMMADRMNNFQMEDQDGGVQLSNFERKNLKVPKSDISLVSGGVKWSLTDMDLTIRARWHTHVGSLTKVSASGHVQVSMVGASIVETMRIGARGLPYEAKPYLVPTSCEVDLGQFHVHFEQSNVQSWILGKLRKPINDNMKQKLPDEICKSVKKSLDVANSNVQKIKLFLHVGHFVFDYRLTKYPFVTADYAELSLKGKVYCDKGYKGDCPFETVDFLPSTNYNSMINIWISEDIANSFFCRAQYHKILAYSLTKDDMTGTQKSFLETSSPYGIGSLISALRNKYPNCDVKMRFTSTKRPKATFAYKKLSASFELTVDLWAYESNATNPEEHFLATVNLTDLVLTVKPDIVNERVVGSLTGYEFKASLVKSEIGDNTDEALTQAIKKVLKYGVVPGLNKWGQLGVPLPVTHQFKFNKTKLHLHTGFFMVSTDVTFK